MAGGNQQGIRSLEIGVRLFQTLQGLGRPATLSELAKLSRMPAAKVHRYCVSLIRTGLVQLDGRGLYGVGPYGFQLSTIRADLELARKVTIAALPRLVGEINETVFASGWGQNGPIVFHVEDPQKPVLVRPNWNSEISLLRSATGRAFAAFFAPDRLDGVIAAELGKEKLVVAQVTSRKRAFHRHLADVHKYGLARTTGEYYAGIASFAAPVFDHEGNVIFVITSFGIAASFSVDWTGTIPKALKTCAADVTRRIGGKAPE